MLYSTIQVLSIIAWVVFNFVYGRRYGYSKSKSFFLAVMYVAFTWFFIFFLTWVCNGFKSFGQQNAVRAFSTLPLVAWIESKIFKIDFRDYLDCCAIGPALTYFVGHIACIFEGCCHGFEYEEGTAAYNIAMKLTGTNMLPQQAFEAFAALLVCLAVYFIAVKHNHHWGGRLLPITLIIYGVQRFFWEFLRDNDKLIIFKEMTGAVRHYPEGSPVAYWGISELALWSVEMIIEGIIFIIVFNHIDKKKAAEITPVKAK